MHLHFEKNANAKCDCNILSLSWMGKVPDEAPEVKIMLSINESTGFSQFIFGGHYFYLDNATEGYMRLTVDDISAQIFCRYITMLQMFLSQLIV